MRVRQFFDRIEPGPGVFFQLRTTRPTARMCRVNRVDRSFSKPASTESPLAAVFVPSCSLNPSSKRYSSSSPPGAFAQFSYGRHPIRGLPILLRTHSIKEGCERTHVAMRPRSRKSKRRSSFFASPATASFMASRRFFRAVSVVEPDELTII